MLAKKDRTGKTPVARLGHNVKSTPTGIAATTATRAFVAPKQRHALLPSRRAPCVLEERIEVLDNYSTDATCAFLRKREREGGAQRLIPHEVLHKSKKCHGDISSTVEAFREGCSLRALWYLAQKRPATQGRVQNSTSKSARLYKWGLCRCRSWVRHWWISEHVHLQPSHCLSKPPDHVRRQRLLRVQE